MLYLEGAVPENKSERREMQGYRVTSRPSLCSATQRPPLAEHSPSMRRASLNGLHREIRSLGAEEKR